MVLPLARSLQALAVLVAATLAINQPDLLVNWSFVSVTTGL